VNQKKFPPRELRRDKKLKVKMILSVLRKSWLYAQSIKMGSRAILGFLPDTKHLHFRGWFTLLILGKKIELFNFNTPLETELFWAKNDSEIEPSLLCFTALAGVATHVLDIGANTGVFALAASAVNKKAKIFAIEPNYSNFMALKANVRRNKLPISCFNLAASSENKLFTLFDFPQEISYSASLNQEFRSGQGAVAVDVFCIKIDEILLRLVSSDLILAKVDVESHEAEVVRGMSNILADSKRQIIFLIEVIRENVSHDLRRLLNANRFAYFQVHEELRELRQVKDLTTFDGFNYLIVSRNILPQVVECLGCMAILPMRLSELY